MRDDRRRATEEGDTLHVAGMRIAFVVEDQDTEGEGELGVAERAARAVMFDFFSPSQAPRPASPLPFPSTDLSS